MKDLFLKILVAEKTFFFSNQTPSNMQEIVYAMPIA